MQRSCLSFTHVKNAVTGRTDQTQMSLYEIIRNQTVLRYVKKYKVLADIQNCVLSSLRGNTEDYLRYAHGLLSAYVSGDLSGALLAHLR